MTAALALLAGLAGTSRPAAADEIATNAGLPWPSGMFNQGSQVLSTFAAWRGGRESDVDTVFFGLTTWDQMIASAPGIKYRLQNANKRLIAAIGMLPNTNVGQLQQCADGMFDAQINSLTTALLNNGGQAAFNAGRPLLIRLGWEANNTKTGYAWRAVGDGTSWAACFRRWVDILDPKVNADGDPATPPERRHRFTIIWNMANIGTIDYSIDNLWPGNDYVDIVASQYYDRCPPLPSTLADGSAAAWDKWDVEWNTRLYKRVTPDNPAGPGAWLDYARDKGKPYAIPEWGVAGPTFVCNTPGIDNPYFIRKMYQFFWWNADDIAFESYFNGHGANDDSRGSHKLFAPDPSFPSPSAANYQSYVGRYAPQSSLTYRQLWSAGVQPPDEPSEPPPPTVPGPQDTLYWLRYVASYPDLIAANATAADAYNDWLNNGSNPNRVAWFEPDDYMARYPAFASQFNNDPIAATQHFIRTGYARGYNWSQWKLYWLRYIASYQDLINQYGTLITGGEAHWYAFGKPQGRSIMFRPVAYLNSNPDAKAACGTDQVCGTTYYITHNQTPSP
ncbi:MAG: hypothetical protein U1E17_11585 [Geminicoccaceae bacterium]